jgi:uncharacterized protein
MVVGELSETVEADLVSKNIYVASDVPAKAKLFFRRLIAWFSPRAAAGAVGARLTPDGATWLHLAAQAGNRKGVQTLLAKGAKVDATAPHGETALILAAQAGHAEVVRLLLASGADVNAKREDGVTALILASQRGFRDVVQTLLDHGSHVNCKGTVGSGVTALNAAAAQGRTELLQLLLAHGAEVDARSGWGKTPLMLAALAGRAEAVETLLDNGADVNGVDGFGNTPLMEACCTGHQGTIQIMSELTWLRARQKGADTCDGPASDQQARQVLRALLARGADVNAKNKFGNTALLDATRNGLRGAAELLLAHGATPLSPQSCSRCSGRGTIQVDSGNTLAGGREVEIGIQNKTVVCPACNGLPVIFLR